MIGRIKADMDGRLSYALNWTQVRMAAHPKILLVVGWLPLGVGLPASFVEIGRGPCRIVACAPDALACWDIDTGLGGEQGRDDRGRDKNKQHERRVQCLTHAEPPLAQEPASEP